MTRENRINYHRILYNLRSTPLSHHELLCFNHQDYLRAALVLARAGLVSQQSFSIKEKGEDIVFRLTKKGEDYLIRRDLALS
ncbi:MAG: hypothetical protein AABX11_06760 [Nanoarchaeota archaeon]